MSAAALARHRSAAWLAERGTGARVVDDALVVVSELVTDGVLHGGQDDIALRLQIVGHYLYVEVTSAVGRDRGAASAAGETHDAGRGLTLVTGCCAAVHARDDRRGYRHVTCLIALARPALPHC